MLRRLASLLALGCCLFAAPAIAQNLRVIPVPWNQRNLAVPHAAYNGHATTFKAIARGGNGVYTVDWDFDGDGTFDKSFTAPSRYDLSTAFTFPTQAARVTFNAVVRVSSNNETVSAVYPVRVLPDVPSDPTNATDRQLQVMRNVAIDDALWWMHQQTVRTGNEEALLTGAQATGYLNHPSAGFTFYGRPQATSGFLWALGLNAHYLAFAPGTYLGKLTTEQAAVNSSRWTTDPYAEDSLRLVNSLVSQAQIVAVAASDEANTYGVYPEAIRPAIAGTDDGFGIFIGANSSDQTTNVMGYALAALAVANLTGLTSQVGDANRILGKPYEQIVQQMVDALTWSQQDTGCGFGAWSYTPNAVICPDAHETMSAINGLWVADQHMSSSGVIVNNSAKVRMSTHLVNNAYAPSATEYCMRYTPPQTGCDFGATASMLQYAAWLGLNGYDAADTRIAFPGYNGFTRGQLRTTYDRYRKFIENHWLTWQLNTDLPWAGGLWKASAGVADFERADHLGNGFSMFHFASAARAHEPDLVLYGAQDWQRQFSIYHIQNQFADGHTQSDWTENYWEAQYGLKWLSTAWTALTLTGEGLPPFALAKASITTAPEGSTITFDARDNDTGTTQDAADWAWDFDDGQSAAQPLSDHAFRDNGVFQVKLTGTSTAGSSVDSVPVTITNVAPSVLVGAAPSSAVEGSAVAFSATVTDPGAADTHTLAWDFDDGGSSTLEAPSHTFDDDGTFTVVATATDDDGARGSDSIVVTVLNAAPTITSTPATDAGESDTYTYKLTSTDPGKHDTHSCSLPLKPTGMTLSGCTLSWTPSYSDLAGATSASVQLCVTDDDFAQTCQGFTIAVALTDADNDGLPDGWELGFFGTIDAQDGASDPDHDGHSNSDEYALGQDPTQVGDLSAPLLLSPGSGVIVGEPKVSLVLLDSRNPNRAKLSYDFELATDITFTNTVDSASDVPESAATTAWSPNIELTENAAYCWRAQARGAGTTSPWSVPACFLHSVVNDPPGTPVPLSPAAGSTIGSTRPVLSWREAADPERNAVFYEVQLATTSDFAEPLASADGIPGGNAVLDATLASDGTTYYWRVRANDDRGATGAWSPPADFVVSQSKGEADADSNGEATQPAAAGTDSSCGCHIPNRRSGAPDWLLAVALGVAVLRKRTRPV